MYGEKLLELQEMMQKIQLLKQIGAEKLVMEMEMQIFKVQQDILQINQDVAIDPVDLILPKKCKFCTEMTGEEDRLLCFEKNGETCKNKPPANMGLLSTAILRVGLMYAILVMGLFTFLILTNIFFTYIDSQFAVFMISAVILAAIFILFKGPVKQVLKMVG